MVESSLDKAELKFEISLKLESSFIKRKNKKLFSPFFVNYIKLDKEIKRARLYITGLVYTKFS